MRDEGMSSADVFCRAISERLSHEGYAIEIRLDAHLVDDLGADSLVVLEYLLALQELGFAIDLAAFDAALLDTGVAYRKWVGTVVGAAVS